MVSAISSSSGLKLYVFLFKKGSSLCVCFNILRAWTLWGWVNSRNLGKNNDSKEVSTPMITLTNLYWVTGVLS